MDDDEAALLRDELDAILRERGPHVGIEFGTEIFDAFQRRGWIRVAYAEVLGLPWKNLNCAAYGTHFAYPALGVGERIFNVGSDV